MNVRLFRIGLAPSGASAVLAFTGEAGVLCLRCGLSSLTRTPQSLQGD